MNRKQLDGTHLVRLVRPMAASRSPGWPLRAVQIGQAYFFRLLAAPCTAPRNAFV